MTHLDEWISVVAAEKRFNASAQAIRRLMKLGVVPGRRDQAPEARGLWPIWTFVHVGSLGEWFGEAARVEHMRKIRATARSLSWEYRIAVCKVFIDHLERREAKERRIQGARGQVEALEVPQSGPSISVVLEALSPLHA